MNLIHQAFVNKLGTSTIGGRAMSVAELKERHEAATQSVNALRDRLKQRRLLLLDTDGLPLPLYLSICLSSSLFFFFLSMLFDQVFVVMVGLQSLLIPGRKGGVASRSAPLIWFAVGLCRVTLERYLAPLFRFFFCFLLKASLPLPAFVDPPPPISSL